jgi:hypothetical protein
MVAQVDGISLTDLMMKAPDSYVVQRRSAPEFQSQGSSGDRAGRSPNGTHPAMLLGTMTEAPITGEAGDAPATGRGRRKDETSG